MQLTSQLTEGREVDEAAIPQAQAAQAWRQAGIPLGGGGQARRGGASQVKRGEGGCSRQGSRQAGQVAPSQGEGLQLCRQAGKNG